MIDNKRGIAILGSTGSIGKQALEVVDEQPEFFRVSMLTANRNSEQLIRQSLKYRPNAVVICDESKYREVREALDPGNIKVFAGHDSIEQLVGMEEIDVVLTGMVGFSGLKPTLKAIEEGKPVALANKETLVVAGELVTQRAREKGVNLLPVDSEHSALFQCIVGEELNPVEKIYLTASGGPFRGKDKSFLEHVTQKDALDHPNWDMGQKITIDSATLMNKGLEVIEAKWLFGLKKEQVDVVIHPQSIIHSMVQFRDGSIKAQLGPPDMRFPIQYALAYPQRLPNSFSRLDLSKHGMLTFEEPDKNTFRNLSLAFTALERRGNSACVLNAANEISVEAFLTEKISFLDIFDLNEKCMEEISFIKKPSFLDYVQTDRETREYAKSLIP